MTGSVLSGKTFVLGVGAQKSGTSWMHNYLRGHAQVTGTRIKELHFFDAWLLQDGNNLRRFWNHTFGLRLVEQLRKSPKERDKQLFKALLDRMRMIDDPVEYFHHFERIATPEINVLTETTPEYALLDEESLTRVRDEFRARELNLRVVYLMRDPVARARSFVLNQAPHRASGTPAERLEKVLSGREDLDHGRYDLTLPRLERVFGEENVFTSFYEDFFDGGTAQVERLCEFIGIDLGEPDLGKRVYASRSEEREDVPEDALRMAEAHYAKTYGLMRERFGDSLPAKWRG